MKAKRETAYGEKPEAVKTHLRNMVIVLLGTTSSSICASECASGAHVIQLLPRPEMIGCLDLLDKSYSVFMRFACFARHRTFHGFQEVLSAYTMASSTSMWRLSLPGPQCKKSCYRAAAIGLHEQSCNWPM